MIKSLASPLKDQTSSTSRWIPNFVPWMYDHPHDWGSVILGDAHARFVRAYDRIRNFLNALTSQLRNHNKFGANLECCACSIEVTIGRRPVGIMNTLRVNANTLRQIRFENVVVSNISEDLKTLKSNFNIFTAQNSAYIFCNKRN